LRKLAEAVRRCKKELKIAIESYKQRIEEFENSIEKFIDFRRTPSEI